MNAVTRMRAPMVFLIAVSSLVAAGCATKGTVTAEKLAVVENAISEAREGTARTSAPLELRSAEEKLEAARAAMKEKEFDTANRIADEALADANYAKAKSASVKSKKMADDLRQSIKSLKEEIERMPAK